MKSDPVRNAVAWISTIIMLVPIVPAASGPKTRDAKERKGAELTFAKWVIDDPEE